MEEDVEEKQQLLRRLPGLFRRWEFADVIEEEKDYRVQQAGMTRDGTELYAIYVGTPEDENPDEPFCRRNA